MVGFCLTLIAVVPCSGSGPDIWPTCVRSLSQPAFEELLVEPTLPNVVNLKGICFQQVLDLTNLERSKVGVEPLRLSSSLSEAAQWMASDMATHNYFDHLDREGRRVDARAYAFGYRAWKSLGENIAAGQESATDTVSQWMNSPCHRRNMLRADFTEMGIGYASNPNSTYGQYWVQTFGTRPSYVASRAR